ncbi:MAG: 16S rRNA (guanine(966)-N(2))-methyltransferase RsmD [Bacteroidia bacterium]
MRIISGKFRAKQIVAPANLPVRPTTDFAKTGLFNILAHKIDFEKVKLLDLCAGTGCISYEFASRGCENILAVDADTKCVKFIRDTFDKLNAIGCEVLRADAFQFLKNCNEKFDVIFADPPYDLKGTERIPQLVFENSLLNPGGLLIVEHSSANTLEGNYGKMETRKYGHVAFTFYQSEIEIEK